MAINRGLGTGGSQKGWSQQPREASGTDVPEEGRSSAHTAPGAEPLQGPARSPAQWADSAPHPPVPSPDLCTLPALTG